MQQTEIAPKNIITIEGNRLIAKFMGAKYAHGYYATNEGVFPGDYCTRLPSELLYHYSWDWLMPVLEKIESQVDNIEIYLSKEWGIEVHIYHKDIFEPLVRVHEKCSKIEAVFMAVIEYIKYYNKNKIK